MKLVRKVAGPGYRQLAAFLRDHLPPSLVVTDEFDGYGIEWTVRVNETPPKHWWQRLAWRAPLVAHVFSNTVSLKRPEWFSDFEQALASYEKETGFEVILEYWESPKKAGAGQ